MQEWTTFHESWKVVYGVQNSSSIPIISKGIKTKALYASRFSLEVAALDVQNSLKHH